MNNSSYKRIKQEVLETNVIGMQGQALGRIEEIVIDVEVGNIIYVMLATRRSSVQLAWDNMTFDEHENAFRVRKRKAARR